MYKFVFFFSRALSKNLICFTNVTNWRLEIHGVIRRFIRDEASERPRDVWSKTRVKSRLDKDKKMNICRSTLYNFLVSRQIEARNGNVLCETRCWIYLSSITRDLYCTKKKTLFRGNTFEESSKCYFRFHNNQITLNLLKRVTDLFFLFNAEFKFPVKKIAWWIINRRKGRSFFIE